MILPKMDVVQYAWVVDSLEHAMEGWLGMGVGPFYTMQVNSDDAIYRGRTEPLSIRVALAQAGATQIELIEQWSHGESAYRDVVPLGQTGFHHVCKFTDDLEGEVAALAAAGVEIAGELPRAGGQRAIYADTRPQMGCMLEILSASNGLLAIYGIVSDGARDWDGTNPIREITPEMIAARQRSEHRVTP